MSGCSVKIDSEEASWSTGTEDRGRQPRRTVRRSRAAISRCRRSIRCRTCVRRCACCSSRWACEVEVHHHEVAGAGQCEIGTKFDPLVQRADWLQILKYVVHNVARQLRQDGDLHAEAGRRRQRFGHARAPVDLEGRARTCSPATATPACRTSRCTTSAASSSTRKRSTRSRTPGPTRYKRLVPGFEAPVNLAYSARNRSASIRIPHVPNPEGPPHRGALPGSDRQSVPRIRRDADGRPGRRAEQDPSGRPDRQEPVRPAAGRGREDSRPCAVARRGAGEPGARIASS